MEAEHLSFDDIAQCDLCRSDDLKLTARVAQGFKYVSIKCNGCRADLTFGRTKADASVFFLRRNEAGTRESAPIVSRDLRGLVKLNPIATWTDTDVDLYIAEHDIIVNPLTNQGYPSIGCMPCTTPVAPGEGARAGRWRDSSKTECGLHMS